jgi:hypothetical protein
MVEIATYRNLMMRCLISKSTINRKLLRLQKTLNNQNYGKSTQCLVLPKTTSLNEFQNLESYLVLRYLVVGSRSLPEELE